MYGTILKGNKNKKDFNNPQSAIYAQKFTCFHIVDWKNLDIVFVS